MLFSLALIILLSLILASIFHKIRVPKILGMILSGIVLGPFVLNLISSDILTISGPIRKIALIVILTRAGLKLDLSSLKEVGRPAILLSFIPATFEIVAYTFLGFFLFKINLLESAMLGCVIAAVSPAIIVPKMIDLIDKKIGTKKNIPQMILAAASVDDIYVIVLLTSFLDVYKSDNINIFSLISLPVSIILGVLLGIIIGTILSKLFSLININSVYMVLIILSISMLLVTLEESVSSIIPFSGLICVMMLNITLRKKNLEIALLIESEFKDVWFFAEILLFSLVGSLMDITTLKDIKFILFSILAIFIALLMRTLGVNMSLIKTNLNRHEKLFTSLAFLPKATVQAAVASLPLQYGVPSGNLILTISVISILITAPLGSFAIDLTKDRFLK